MLRFWQVVAVVFVTGSFLGAEEVVKSFAWKAPKVEKSIFSHELRMLDSEREDFATNLAAEASNRIAAAMASPTALGEGRRMIALALQLSLRNRRALVLNFKLSKGVLPEISQNNYSPQVLARLILTRGQCLAKQEDASADDQKLARYFIQLAAELDPKNDDAVYASELQRLDQGAVNWGAVTDADGGKK